MINAQCHNEDSLFEFYGEKRVVFFAVKESLSSCTANTDKNSSSAERERAQKSREQLKKSLGVRKEYEYTGGQQSLLTVAQALLQIANSGKTKMNKNLKDFSATIEGLNCSVSTLGDVSNAVEKPLKGMNVKVSVSGSDESNYAIKIVATPKEAKTQQTVVAPANTPAQTTATTPANDTQQDKENEKKQEAEKSTDKKGELSDESRTNIVKYGKDTTPETLTSRLSPYLAKDDLQEKSIQAFFEGYQFDGKIDGDKVSVKKGVIDIPISGEKKYNIHIFDGKIYLWDKVIDQAVANSSGDQIFLSKLTPDEFEKAKKLVPQENVQ